MTPELFIAKARAAPLSSKTLLHAGDNDGASSRAYYAMFHAARAALLHVDAPPEALAAKTHRGLQAAFNQYLVRANAVPKEFGAHLRRAEEFRLFGDYSADQVSRQDAQDMYQLAARFVDEISRLLGPSPGGAVTA